MTSLLGINEKMSLETIYIYNDLQTATLAKMRLEAEGIDAHIHSSGMIGILGALNAFGGVRLQVPEHVADKAKDIISAFNKDLQIDD